MKTLFAALMFLCLAVLPASSQAPPKAPPQAQAPPANDEAVHNELRGVRDGLIAAMNKGDIEKQLAYLHPNVVVTWHNAEVSRGRDGVRAYLTRMLSGPNKVLSAYSANVEVDELTILYGGETGISFGSAIEHFTLNNGTTIDLPARWSATLVKTGDKWLVASLHASDNLFDNPVLAMAKRTAYWAGGVCLVVGLLIGMLIGRARKKA
jgi:ketosteroid isomerase-like protein